MPDELPWHEGYLTIGHALLLALLPVPVGWQRIAPATRQRDLGVKRAVEARGSAASASTAGQMAAALDHGVPLPPCPATASTIAVAVIGLTSRGAPAHGPFPLLGVGLRRCSRAAADHQCRAPTR